MRMRLQGPGWKLYNSALKMFQKAVLLPFRVLLVLVVVAHGVTQPQRVWRLPSLAWTQYYRHPLGERNKKGGREARGGTAGAEYVVSHPPLKTRGQRRKSGSSAGHRARGEELGGSLQRTQLGG